MKALELNDSLPEAHNALAFATTLTIGIGTAQSGNINAPSRLTRTLRRPAIGMGSIWEYWDELTRPSLSCGARKS